MIVSHSPSVVSLMNNLMVAFVAMVPLSKKTKPAMGLESGAMTAVASNRTRMMYNASLLFVLIVVFGVAVFSR